MLNIHKLKSNLYEAKIKSQYTFVFIIAMLILLTIISIGIAVSVGQVKIPVEISYRIILYKIFGIRIGNINELISGSNVDIVWLIRLPRVIMAMIVGAGLSMCGVIMQASVQNPLADPYILGISSGAALGATFSILIGFGAGSILGQMGIAFWAFAGALIAALAVLVLANIGGKMSSVKLVLAGVVVNALCSAFSNFIIYIANDAEGIKTVTFWTMGSFASAKWDKLPILAIAVLSFGVYFIFQSRTMNTMLLGDEVAITLGVDLNKFRRMFMLLASLVTGIIVATCGIIGFVGLIIPHIVRSFVGSDHKILLPISIFASSIFLIWADVFARTLIKTGEIPIGIITALLGAPIFMYILVKKNYGFGGK